MSCRWLNESTENDVVVGQVSCFLYRSITLIKSFKDVSGKKLKIAFAIVSLSLLLTKSSPF